MRAEAGGQCIPDTLESIVPAIPDYRVNLGFKTVAGPIVATVVASLRGRTASDATGNISEAMFEIGGTFFSKTSSANLNDHEFPSAALAAGQTVDSPRDASRSVGSTDGSADAKLAATLASANNSPALAESGDRTDTIASVANLAALKALNVSNVPPGTIAYVRGYLSTKDGGEGFFSYDPASSRPDDGGTVIAPNLGIGRWLRVYSGSVNVLWFGAKGDWNGSVGTDNSRAIQNAVNVSIASPHQGRAPSVYLPAGIYRITAAISCAAGSVNTYGSAIIRGEGMYRSQIYIDGTSDTDGLVWSPASQYVNGGGLFDVGVTSRGAGHSRDCVVAVNMSEWKVENVLASNSGRYCLHLAKSKLTTVVNGRFSSSSSAGVLIGNETATGYLGTTARFDHCYFGLNSDQGAIVAYRQTDTTFNSCTFEGNGYAGGVGAAAKGQGLYGLAGIIATHACYFENNTGHDAWFGDSSRPIDPPYLCIPSCINNSYHGGSHHTQVGTANVFFDQVYGGENIGGIYGVNPGTFSVELSAKARSVVAILSFPTYQPLPVDSAGTALVGQSSKLSNYLSPIATNMIVAPASGDAPFAGSLLLNYSAPLGYILLGGNGQRTRWSYDGINDWFVQGTANYSSGELTFHGLTNDFRIVFDQNGGISVGNPGTRPLSRGITSFGSIEAWKPGSTLIVRSGANAKSGCAQLVAGTVTVLNSSVTANSVIHVAVKPGGGTVTAAPYVSTASVGVGFTIVAGATDTAKVNWWIEENN